MWVRTRKALALLVFATAVFLAATIVLLALTLEDALAPSGIGFLDGTTGPMGASSRVLLVGALTCAAVSGAFLCWLAWVAVRRLTNASRDLHRQGEALRLSERRYRETVDHAVVGMLRVAGDGTIQGANPALVRMLGYRAADELIGRNVALLYRDPRDRERMIADVGTRSAVSGVALAWKRRDGTPLTVRISSRVDRDASGTLVGFDDIVEDVTERVELGEQLRHAQKMEAVGRLAGGIAHDFNNLLTVIVGNTELLATETELSAAAADCVEQIRSAATTAASVTRQLLLFSRKGLNSPQAVNVNRAVSDVERMIERLIGEDIRVFSNLHPAAGDIFVDPAHLEQALINLAVNARDAMPQGGVLIFETAPAQDGRAARINVRDSGHGMDDVTRQRACEPFFTTKPAGKGSGLGLSMVYGFVQNAGGTMTIHSTPGRGTVVSLEFPHAQSMFVAPSDGVPIEPAQSARLLVVEDQDSVRALIGGVLEKRGFTVLQATNAHHARRVLSTDRRIDLVLTDVVMPGETGLELAEWMRTAYPGTRVTFMSGYSDHAAMGTVPPDNLLRKPFTPQALLAHVRAVLRRDAPCAAGV
jgi:two-component system, cell cycle sensor histidine kinase and response regulator CckA